MSRRGANACWRRCTENLGLHCICGQRLHDLNRNARFATPSTPRISGVSPRAGFRAVRATGLAPETACASLGGRCLPLRHAGWDNARAWRQPCCRHKPKADQQSSRSSACRSAQCRVTAHGIRAERSKGRDYLRYGELFCFAINGIGLGFIGVCAIGSLGNYCSGILAVIRATLSCC